MPVMALSTVCAARVAPVASPRRARVCARAGSAVPAGRVVLGARHASARLSTGARRGFPRVAAGAEDAAEAEIEGKKGDIEDKGKDDPDDPDDHDDPDDPDDHDEEEEDAEEEIDFRIIDMAYAAVRELVTFVSSS